MFSLKKLLSVLCMSATLLTASSFAEDSEVDLHPTTQVLIANELDLALVAMASNHIERLQDQMENFLEQKALDVRSQQEIVRNQQELLATLQEYQQEMRQELKVQRSDAMRLIHLTLNTISIFTAACLAPGYYGVMPMMLGLPVYHYTGYYEFDNAALLALDMLIINFGIALHFLAKNEAAAIQPAH